MPDFKERAREIAHGNTQCYAEPKQLCAANGHSEQCNEIADDIEAALSQAYEEGARAEKARSAQECRQEVARTPMLKHAYVPHSDYPWFCDVCGYPEHEVMQHDRAAISTQGDGLT